MSRPLRIAPLAGAVLFGAVLVLAARGPVSAGVPPSCDPGRAHDPGSFDQTVASGGVERDYILHVPQSYADAGGTDAIPLVLNFHGLGGSAAGQASFSGLPDKADEEGFLVVSPQGIGVIPHWNVTLAPGPGEADDVAFVSDLVDALESQLCVDSTRIYSTGMSNGGLMSSRLACSLPDRIAAVAPVAGLYFPPIFDFGAEPEGCPSQTRAASIIAFHGTADTTVPWNGGPGIFDIEFRLSILDAAAAWAENDGCDPVPTEDDVTATVSVVRYGGCDDDALVELYVIEDGGHTWPRATSSELIGATDAMWQFFQAHPLPAQQIVATPTSTPPEPLPTTTAQEPSPSPPPTITEPTSTVVAVALPTTGAGGGSRQSPVALWSLAVLSGIATAGFGLAGAAWYSRRRRQRA